MPRLTAFEKLGMQPNSEKKPDPVFFRADYVIQRILHESESFTLC